MNIDGGGRTGIGHVPPVPKNKVYTYIYIYKVKKK
jgi:hypothetical protein